MVRVRAQNVPEETGTIFTLSEPPPKSESVLKNWISSPLTSI